MPLASLDSLPTPQCLDACDSASLLSVSVSVCSGLFTVCHDLSRTYRLCWSPNRGRLWAWEFSWLHCIKFHTWSCVSLVKHPDLHALWLVPVCSGSCLLRDQISPRYARHVLDEACRDVRAISFVNPPSIQKFLQVRFGWKRFVINVNAVFPSKTISTLSGNLMTSIISQIRVLEFTLAYSARRLNFESAEIMTSQPSTFSINHRRHFPLGDGWEVQVVTLSVQTVEAQNVTTEICAFRVRRGEWLASWIRSNSRLLRGFQSDNYAPMNGPKVSQSDDSQWSGSKNCIQYCSNISKIWRWFRQHQLFLPATLFV